MIAQHTIKQLAVFALLAAAAVFAAMANPVRHPAFSLMTEAARKQKSAQHTLYLYKMELGLYDAKLDPNRTGVVGVESSPITTTLGYLKSKRAAAHPDFAAYVVRELIDHGIGADDSVVVTMTGSFPGLNLAVLMALETLEIPSLRLVSIGASSYGANQEAFTWLDMEDALVRAGKLHRRSDYVSFGGTGDVGGGLSEEGKLLIRLKSERLGYPILQSRSLKQQSKLRRKLVGSPKHYKLLINIGGNHAMMGKTRIGRELPGGWINPSDISGIADSTNEVSGIIFEFLEAGVPVLNLLHVESIASAFQIPFDPDSLPPPGQTGVYFLREAPVVKP